MKCIRTFILILLVFFTLHCEYSQAEGTYPLKKKSATVNQFKSSSANIIEQQYLKMGTTRGNLKELVGKPGKRNLTAEERAAWQKHDQWLRSIIKRLEEQRKKHKDIMAKMVGLQAQFLSLQQKMQSESRRYQTISNVLTASHQSARDSIRNMR